MAVLLVLESDLESAFLARAPGDSDITGPETTLNVSDWRVARHWSLCPEKPHTPGQSPTRARPGPAFGVLLFCPTWHSPPRPSEFCHVPPREATPPRSLCITRLPVGAGRRDAQGRDWTCSSPLHLRRAEPWPWPSTGICHRVPLVRLSPILSFENESGFDTGERL